MEGLRLTASFTVMGSALGYIYGKSPIFALLGGILGFIAGVVLNTLIDKGVDFLLSHSIGVVLCFVGVFAFIGARIGEYYRNPTHFGIAGGIFGIFAGLVFAHSIRAEEQEANSDTKKPDESQS